MLTQRVSAMRRAQRRRCSRHLRTMPVDQLLNAQRALMASLGAFPFRITVDGVVLDRSPLESVRSGSARKVRLLAGSNHDESSFFVRGAALNQPIGPREIQNMPMDRDAGDGSALRGTLFPI